ncbi:MAG: hypothetical protein CMQ05_06800 [Gammaproteobacteria bacterium]|nr:hypothetical protein [Gammaproteobacteria bacterium]
MANFAESDVTLPPISHRCATRRSCRKFGPQASGHGPVQPDPLDKGRGGIVMLKVAIFSFLLTTLFAINACGGGGGSSDNSSPPPTTGGGSGSGGDSGGDEGGGDDEDDDAGDSSGDGGSGISAGEPIATITTDVGRPTFLSPHSKPIVRLGNRIYATNTPADTLDIIDRSSRSIVSRVNVGVDPVGLAVKPDGSEIWVTNHISDSVSVVDTDAASPTFHQVIATIQDVDNDLSTTFDEPVGIAFANDSKAYVALSTDNQVAVINVETYTVTRRLSISAQDPRAVTVRNNRLYVTPFESNNRSQLSGCTQDKVGTSDICTFDAVEHVFSNNNVLSTFYDADIIINPDLPDRDIFVFNTANDLLIDTVETVGTLLYGTAVDSNGTVFVAQTDARNTANGRAGTLKEGLAEMDNRAFLNQITRIACPNADCTAPVFYDLEPVPPTHPAPGEALATPFGIQISDDDTTLVATAAGSDRLFTVSADAGTVLGSVGVGAVPRGIALESNADGSPAVAWVLNVADNTVSVVDLTDPASPLLQDTIIMEDPTHPVVKQGRIAFNDADASTTGTFSCESCHPDGHTDQLIWVLETPICDVPGCTQIAPRLTMPVRGLRDTQPYHWDGIPGDPYGGNNTRSINADETPNCSIDDPVTCTRHLVNGTLATTMCEVGNCSLNDEGLNGALDSPARDALATFLLSVPFPPAKTRPYHNELTDDARFGFFEFNFINDAGGRSTGAQTCGACHRPPFLVSTNTPGTGMEAPTWRGAYDRWMITPQARLNIIDLLNIVNMDSGFPEENMWELAGSSASIWQMVVQGSTGYSGAFARQVTLNPQSADETRTRDILDSLEASAIEGGVQLQGHGATIAGTAASDLSIYFNGSAYATLDDTESFTRDELITMASAGELVLTLTGHAGTRTDVENPQPALWGLDPLEAQTREMVIPFLSDELTLTLSGRHIQAGASVYINGRRVNGSVACQTGTLDNCTDEIILVTLTEAPTNGGWHFLQVQNVEGLFSNDMLFFSEQNPMRPRAGNIIASGGSFNSGQFGRDWNTVEIAAVSFSESGGQLHVQTDESDEPWHTQISHNVLVTGGQQYTICYRARADAGRIITAYTDTNLDSYTNTSGQQFQANLTTSFQNFEHTFTIAETDLRGRIAFDLSQSDETVHFDHIGMFEGDACGDP